MITKYIPPLLVIVASAAGVKFALRAAALGISESYLFLALCVIAAAGALIELITRFLKINY